MLLTYLLLAAFTLPAIYLCFVISAIRSIRSPRKISQMAELFTTVRCLEDNWPPDVRRIIMPRQLRSFLLRNQSIKLLYLREFLLDAAHQARNMLEISEGSGLDSDGRVKLREAARRLLRYAILRIVRVRFRMILFDHSWCSYPLLRYATSRRIFNARFQSAFSEFMEVSKEFTAETPASTP